MLQTHVVQVRPANYKNSAGRKRSATMPQMPSSTKCCTESKSVHPVVAACTQRHGDTKIVDGCVMMQLVNWPSPRLSRNGKLSMRLSTDTQHEEIHMHASVRESTYTTSADNQARCQHLCTYKRANSRPTARLWPVTLPARSLTTSHKDRKTCPV